MIDLKIDIIKPGSKKSNYKSIFTPIVYLIIGILLAFKSNEVVTVFFYIVGVLLIIYGIKSLFSYYKGIILPYLKKIQFSMGLISIIIGLLVIVFAEVIEVSTRFILGFILIYIGLSRMLSQISFGVKRGLTYFSSIVLIILGMYSILVSSVIFVIIGWVLIANSIVLFIDYFRN